MQSLYAFLVANQQPLAILACMLLPTLITGLSKKPGPATDVVVRVLQLVLGRLSLVTHVDASGTFKLPLAPAHDTAPAAPPPKGFASLWLLALLAALALLLPAAAHAQATAPGPTAPPVIASSLGGCVGQFCFQPSVVVAPLAINLRSKTVEAGFQPGLGYGITFHQGQWYSFGVDVYVNVDVGTQRAAIAVLGKAINGYLRFGWSKGFIGDSNATAPRLLWGLGTDL